MSAAEGRLRIEVVAAWPDTVLHHVFDLPSGSTVADALRAFVETAGEVDTSHGVGVFGQACDPATVLRDGDRVEIHRPLLADAKQARRERARR